MQDRRGQMIEWIIVLVTTLLLPCVVTLFLSGTEKREEKLRSGIILVDKNGKEFDMEEFLPYVIASEIDLEYELETIKAQTVIARTNLMRELNGKKKEKIENLSLTYLSTEKFESSFGDKAKEKMLYKLNKAVRMTNGEILVYENNYIDAMYHEISSGITASAEEIYGKDRAYLKSVDSSQDVEAEEYMEILEWNKSEVLGILQKAGLANNITEGTLIQALKIVEKSQNGYVKKIQVGMNTMDGEKWKDLFGLKSTNFYIEEYDAKVRMITLGKGHGIGMSQYGANCMAREKANYRTILEKYFPGTKIRENSAIGV